MDFSKINEEKLEKELDYFNKYYGSSFKKEQGTEEILDMINNYSLPGTLIDFGSGSNIYFWLLAFKNISSVCCVDISIESFFINEKVRKKQLYPLSCEYTIEKYNKNFEEILKTNIEYKISDVFQKDFNINKKFNNVTQFGLLGLCKTEDDYITQFKKLFNCLEKGGIFIGANWLFKEKYSEEKGFKNNYLNEELINKISLKYNCKIIQKKLVPIKNDDNYSHVLIYALEKNE